MTNNNDALLSALYDGELSGSELDQALARIREQDSARQQFASYGLISAAMKREVSAEVNVDVADRVRIALDAEPTVLSPVSRQAASRPFVRQVAGFALAASLTAVAILGIRQYQADQPQPTLDVATSTTSQDWIRVSGTRWNRQQPEVENKLNTYLVSHSQYASGAGVQGTIGYARIAGYDAANEGQQVEENREPTNTQ